MVIRVACLTHAVNKRYRGFAEAMASGIAICGDVGYVHPLNAARIPAATVGASYGWKWRAKYQCYDQFVYGDLGYWNRETSYRLVVGGWSPESYVRAGLPHGRLRDLGVEVKPVNTSGDTIVIAGCSAKSSIEHGLIYRKWEVDTAEALQGCGKRIVYRPKPTDKMRSPIPGTEYDDGPIEATLARASAFVSHHSNACIDALVAGVPVHCVTGAAAAFSVPLADIAGADMPEGREQFLADVAWLNWSLEEMRRGEAWRHLKERGLIC